MKKILSSQNLFLGPVDMQNNDIIYKLLLYIFSQSNPMKISNTVFLSFQVLHDRICDMFMYRIKIHSFLISDQIIVYLNLEYKIFRFWIYWVLFYSLISIVLNSYSNIYFRLTWLKCGKMNKYNEINDADVPLYHDTCMLQYRT